MKPTKLFTLIVLISLFLLTACSGEVAETAVSTPTNPVLAETANALAEEPAAADSDVFLPTVTAEAVSSLAVTIPDTGQEACYNVSGSQITCPSPSDPFFGQDANYSSYPLAYQGNGDGTITDLNTGLMWQQSPERDGNGTINAADKLSYTEALADAEASTLAGYDDWRLPTITELYSLMDFNGFDVSGYNGSDTAGLVPFIDTDTFEFGYGDTTAGERIIDAQFASSTLYVSTTMNNAETMFGVNFADGRIKGYPTSNKEYYVLLVRGTTEYDSHSFTDNGNGTISDSATGLMWQQGDSGSGMVWEDALNYCESLSLGGYEDWRLPNVKELQHLVDYGRSPDTTNFAAIDPLFSATQITNEAGQPDYAVYWSGTTHANFTNVPGASASYVVFGEAMGNMNGNWIDVHGAGAQRSDPKTGDPNDYPEGHGPQGDAIRIYNFVRCVRSDEVAVVSGTFAASATIGLQTQTSGAAVGGDTAVAGGPLAEAAAQLGVTEQELQTALGDPELGPPDLMAVAEQLGVSVEVLEAALGTVLDLERP